MDQMRMNLFSRHLPDKKDLRPVEELPGLTPILSLKVEEGVDMDREPLGMSDWAVGSVPWVFCWYRSKSSLVSSLERGISSVSPFDRTSYHIILQEKM